MKAAVFTRYGPPDIVEIEDVERPVAGDGEVLLKVRAAGVNPLDWHLMRGEPYALRLFFGLRKPRNTRLGRDVAGRVEVVGGRATRFKPGDAVFGVCRGAFAEYACASESALAVKPDNVTFEQAASVPVAGFTALQGLRDKGRIQPEHKVLINGAAGGVGTFAVQIAKSLGAEVTGVCSTRNVDMVRAIGADHVIDYTQEDFTRSGQRYDLILDCVGNHSLSACRRALNPKGRCVMVGGPGGFWTFLARGVKALAMSPFVSRKFITFMARRNQEDLTLLRELMAAGKLTPVIDRRYQLREAAEAIGYLEEGHARGKVVITLDRSRPAGVEPSLTRLGPMWSAHVLPCRRQGGRAVCGGCGHSWIPASAGMTKKRGFHLGRAGQDASPWMSDDSALIGLPPAPLAGPRPCPLSRGRREWADGGEYRAPIGGLSSIGADNALA
jgi:NADPH:quinone reductase-like Zn-dependent oxidoreductase